MNLRARLGRIERQAKSIMPAGLDPDLPDVTPEQLEEAYQAMLQDFAQGEYDRWPGARCCILAMLTNRLPDDFEQDVLEVCGVEAFRELFRREPNDGITA